VVTRETGSEHEILMDKRREKRSPARPRKRIIFRFIFNGSWYIKKRSGWNWLIIVSW
jgi:hypothetical protein